MSEHKRKAKIGNKCTREKMMETQLWWFGQVRRPLEAPMKKVGQMEDIPIKRCRGRPKKTLSGSVVL